MKYKLLLFLLLVVYVFTGCVSDIEPEYVHTNIDIQFSDDVSPCRATLIPELVGEEPFWKINGESVDGALVSDSGVLELILEPNTEIHINYETVLENRVYFNDNLLEAPPVANKLILYSMNLSNETFNEQPESLNAQYDYDFNYSTETSVGSVSGGGGAALNYIDSLDVYEFYQPLEVQLTPVFDRKNTPHIFNIDVLHDNQKFVTSSEDIQALYFNYRFSYDDASVNNPNTIVFTDELSNREYELQVDWIYELAM